MASTSIAPPSTDEPAPKRPRTEEQPPAAAAAASTASNTLAVVPVNAQIAEAAQEEAEISLLPRAFERLSLSINADYVAKLNVANVIGYARPVAQIRPIARYYQINVETFRTSIANLMTEYLTTKLYESGTIPFVEADAEVAAIVPIIANACMAALYAKLHTQFQTYANRFTTRPSYTKDIELPLPLADAIQNFGVFSPVGTLTNYVCVPVYPENIQNEGRSTQLWSSLEDESYLPYLKLYGIPVKSVDTRIKVGSPWWTYKVTHVDGHFDFRCIFPPSNYSDHTAILAAMFARINQQEQVQAIITHREDDQDYPVKLREIPAEYPLQAFGALCHAPYEEWIQYLLTSD